MTRPDLSRRVERTEEDLVAISDTVLEITVLEIKGIVDLHTGTLAAHGRELVAIRETQAQQGETLAQHGEMLAQHGEMLAQHGEMLTQHGEMLTQHGEMLTEILRRLDAR